MAQRETKITIIEDKTTGMASSLNGANLDGVAFNLSLLSNVNPSLTNEIFELYERARKLDVPK